MTEDYKDNLLKYLTGNLNIETGGDYPMLNQNIETLNNNIYENVNNKLNNPYRINILGKIYNSIYDNYLIYGYYEEVSGGDKYGFIYLVDGNLNEIQMITTFSSGTRLFPITALNQDENNNIYGLSGDDNVSPHVSRVLLFNNIFTSGLISGNYEAILRNSYIVPYNYNQSPYRQNRIIKSPESSTYYMIFRDTDNLRTKIVRFTINVGAENEWVQAEIPYAFSTTRFDVKLDKSSGEEVVHYYTISSDSSAVYRDYIINGENVTLNKNISLDSPADAMISQVFVKDIDNIYLYIHYQSSAINIIYKIVGDQLKKIYEIQSQPSPAAFYVTTVTLFEINNGIFFFEKYRDLPNYNISIGYISNDDSYIKYLVGTYTGTAAPSATYEYVDFYYKNNYNLVNLYAPMYSDTNTTKKITLDYNSINYNGEGYENVNSLSPNKARLYDNNNKMIFARNLYNKVINGNTTISTLNIPNINLNNIIIYNQSLIGETNYVLMSNQEEITKNIYENLNINFYVTLRMINNNDPNNQIFNQVGSNRINLSVSSVKDYNNAKVTKIRINYSDNSFKIQNINFNLAREAYTEFIIYVNKNIASIDFISNDENTIYNTIRPEFEIGKYYKISQSVYVN